MLERNQPIPLSTCKTVHYYLADVLEPNRAWSFLANTTALSASGTTSLAISVPVNRCAHAARSGVLPSSRKVTPNILRIASSQNRLHPTARSRYPTESPAKKGFPFDDSMENLACQKGNHTPQESAPTEASKRFMCCYVSSLRCLQQHPTDEIERGKMVITCMNGAGSKEKQGVASTCERPLDRWVKPPEGWNKLNVDGSFSAEACTGGGG